MKLGRIGAVALPVAAVAVTMGTAAIPLTANAAGSARAAAHQPSSPYGLYDCANKPVVRPGTFDIFCDGSQSLTGLKWSEWDSGRAIGSGVDWVDNCTPNCAQGKWSKQNAIVVLWRPEPVHGHKGQFGYSKMTLLFPATGKIDDSVPPGAF